ncbi:hypothetical protein ACHQM5_030333 [Ranunculus cassubicifolius]
MVLPPPSLQKAALTLLYYGMIVTMDPSNRVFKNGAILIEGDTIKQIGQSSQLLQQYQHRKDVQLIDLKGKYIIPGLVNTHVHTSLHLERGLANDVSLLTWLNERGLPFEANMTENDSYISTLACGIELIRSGVTSFAEAGGQHVPGMVRAVKELGLRAVLTQSNFDAPQLFPGFIIPPSIARTTDDIIQSQIQLYNNYNGQADGRIKIWFGIRQIVVTSPELLIRTRDTAKQLKTGIHMQVAEIQAENQFVVATYGVDHGTVTYLEKLKLLDRNFLAASSVWISDSEINFLAKANASITHGPSMSMYFLGFSPIKEMLAAGVNVGIGTDGPSNNRMSIIDEMYVGALSYKVRSVFTTNTTDPTSIRAEAVLKMATIDGAKALMWENEIGSLEVGKKADLVVVDPFVWTTSPVIDKIASLVYSTRTENIESVMCDGKWIMRDRKILTVNENKVLRSAEKASAEILNRAGLVIPQRMNFI